MGLALAGAGEWVIRANKIPGLGLFSTSSRSSCSRWAHGRSRVRRRKMFRFVRRGWIALAVCLAGAIAAHLGALVALSRDLRSPTAVRLWLAGLALLFLEVRPRVGRARGRPAGREPTGPEPAPAHRGRDPPRGGRPRGGAFALRGARPDPSRNQRGRGGSRRHLDPDVARVRRRKRLRPGWYHISNVFFWTLARFMEVFGVSVAGARTLGAFAGFVTVLVVLAWASVISGGGSVSSRPCCFRSWEWH